MALSKRRTTRKIETRKPPANEASDGGGEASEAPSRDAEKGPSRRVGTIEWAIVGLTLLLLLGSLATEIGDTDFWWHLETGEWIVTEGSLPYPDPFSYTSEMGEESYPGERRVRRFNLTHEWLAQALWFLIWKAGGYPALVLWKSLLLTAFLAAAGWLVWGRTGSIVAATLAVVTPLPIVGMFAADRPALVTFALVALLTVLLDRYRRCGGQLALYTLPLVLLLWANAHGGFFLGWVVMGAYAAEALGWSPDRRNPLWIASLAAVLISGLNPNGFNVVPVLLDYRTSFLTQTLIEWTRPPLWGPPYIFQALLYSGAVVMAWRFLARRRDVRASDALLLAAFGAAGMIAFRNAAFTAWFGSLMLFGYGWPLLASRLPAVDGRTARTLVAALLIALVGRQATEGKLFELRTADWKIPVDAAAFVKQHASDKRIFNSYEFGGYLIRTLGPEQKTFIDGRALNEAVYRDYRRILSGQRAEREALLAEYGVELIVTGSFEFVSGVMYPLPLSLADPSETGWELVFQDAQALVFARNNEANAALIASNRIDKRALMEHLSEGCAVYIEKDPELAACARSLGMLYGRMGLQDDARRWLARYRELWPYADSEVDAALRGLPR